MLLEGGYGPKSSLAEVEEGSWVRMRITTGLSFTTLWFLFPFFEKRVTTTMAVVAINKASSQVLKLCVVLRSNIGIIDGDLWMHDEKKGSWYCEYIEIINTDSIVAFENSNRVLCSQKESSQSKCKIWFWHYVLIIGVSAACMDAGYSYSTCKMHFL